MSIFDLPSEIFEIICFSVSIEDIITLFLTCRSINEYNTEDIFIYHPRINMVNNNIMLYLTRVGHLQTLKKIDLIVDIVDDLFREMTDIIINEEHYEMLEWAMKREYEYIVRTYLYRDDLKMLDFINTIKKLKFETADINCIIYNNNPETIRFLAKFKPKCSPEYIDLLYENGYHQELYLFEGVCGKDLMIQLIREKDYELVGLFVRRGIVGKSGNSSCYLEEASSMNNIRMMNRLKDCSLSRQILQNYVKFGHHTLLKLAWKTNGYLFDKCLADISAQENRYEILIWLEGLGFTPRSTASENAIKNGWVDIVRFFMMYSTFPFDCADLAAEHNQLEVLVLLMSNGYEVTSVSTFSAVTNNNVQMLSYLVSYGVPIDKGAVEFARDFELTEVLKFLEEIYVDIQEESITSEDYEEDELTTAIFDDDYEKVLTLLVNYYPVEENHIELALECENPEIINLLMTNIAEDNNTDSFGSYKDNRMSSFINSPFYEDQIIDKNFEQGYERSFDNIITAKDQKIKIDYTNSLDNIITVKDQKIKIYNSPENSKKRSFEDVNNLITKVSPENTTRINEMTIAIYNNDLPKIMDLCENGFEISPEDIHLALDEGRADILEYFHSIW